MELHKPCTHVSFWKSSFISEISEIYKPYPSIYILHFSPMMILVAGCLRLGANAFSTGGNQCRVFKNNNVAVHVESGRTLLTFL